MTKTANVLIVSTAPAVVKTLTPGLNELGHAVCGVVAGRDIGPAKTRPDLAVVDLGLDREAGAAIRAATRVTRRLDAAVLYLADSMDDPRLRRACATAPFGYLVKPVDTRQLGMGVDAALIAHASERGIRERAGSRERARSTAVPAPRRDGGASGRDARWEAQLARTIIAASPEGIVVLDAAGRFVRVNTAAKQIVGNSEAESLDEWLSDYVVLQSDGRTPLAEEDRPDVRALRGERAQVAFILRSRENAARVLHLNVTAGPLTDAAGRLSGALMVVRNDTGTVKTAAELRLTIGELHDRRQFGRAVLESVSDGVVVIDTDMNFTTFNSAAERIVGVGATDNRSDAWSERYGIFHPDQVTPVPADELPLVRAARGEQVEDMNLFIRNPRVPQGTFISVNATPLLDADYNRAGGVAVFRDVTRRVLEREALTKAFADGRVEVIDTILHNVGNAINSVAVGIGTIREKSKNNDTLRRLASLRDLIREHEGDWDSWVTTTPQGRHVLPYVLMLVGRLTDGNDELLKTVRRVQTRVRHIVDIVRTQEMYASRGSARKVVNLKSTIDDAVLMLQESLSKRGIEIDVDCAGAPDDITVHESRFHQMLINLVKNAGEAIDQLRDLPPSVRTALDAGRDRAVPHGAGPRIRIVACREGDSLNIEVSDTGIGIAKQSSDFIFTPGYTTKDSGSGFGLHSIAKYVTGVGGRVRALSEGIGRGAAVRVTLPLSGGPDAPADDAGRRQASSEDGERGRRGAAGRRPTPSTPRAAAPLGDDS